jgi:hypothetical protein
MAKEKKTTRRTKVKDLPKKEKALSKKEQKKVKGGTESLTMDGQSRYVSRFPERSG